MGLRVVIRDPLPLFRHGVEAVLTAGGHIVETPDDLLAWAMGGHDGVVLLSLLTDHDWDLLAQLRDTSPVVALLDSEQAAVGARAVWTGAMAVLLRDVTANALLRTVEATADGQVVLPVAVLAAFAGGPSMRQPALTTEQLSWLRQLSTGSTVAQLADRAGYSEREMFRLLKALYREMEVEGRTQAMLRAQKLGWLSG